MTEVGSATARRGVFGLWAVAALAAVAVQVIEGPPGSGYGWGSVVVSCLLLAVPLLAVGAMVGSGERRFAWPAVGVGAIMVAVVLMALVGNWAGQSTTDRALDAGVALLVLLAAAGAALVEIPLLRGSRSPTDSQPPARHG